MNCASATRNWTLDGQGNWSQKRMHDIEM